MLVSPALAEEARRRGIKVSAHALPLAFDADGELPPLQAALQRETGT
jgi:hypothetical protein